MADYRQMAIGTKFEGRIGEVAQCPHCPDHALEVEDYVYPLSSPPEKEKVYIHFDFLYQAPRKNAKGEIIYDVKAGVNACRQSSKS